MNILLTCAGRRNYLVEYFKKALGNRGKVLATNSSAFSSALSTADKSFITPEINNSKYLDTLVDICVTNEVRLLVPLFDLELPLLAKSKNLFIEKGIFPLISSSDVVDICFDKYRTFTFLRERKFNTPLTFLSLDDAVSAIEQNRISFPLVIKPRWGAGSICIHYADNLGELSFFYQYCKKELKNTYIPFNQNGQDIIIQEKIGRGEEYGMDVLNDLNGRYTVCFVKKKHEMRSGETDSSITVMNDSISSIGKKLGRTLRHIGNLDVDIIMHKDKPYILELNPRFGGGYPFTHLAGANIPAVLLAWLTNKPIKKEWLSCKPNIKGVKGINIFKTPHA
jgi:carbamoyl-phosphate synthase large subunit